MASSPHRSLFRRRAVLAVGMAAGLFHLSATPVPARLPGSLPAVRVGELRAVLERWGRGPEAGAGVQVTDPLLAARIEELRTLSPTFGRAWAELQGSGVPVVIGTRGQLESVLPADVRDSDGWAGVTVSWNDGNGRLARSAVVIRLDWLRDLHARYGASAATFLEAVDGLLIHEVYGHLVPVVQAGTAEERCADPRPGQRLKDSCVGRRELPLRAEREAVLAAQ